MIRLRYMNVPEGAKENSNSSINVENQPFADFDLIKQESTNSQLATLEKNYTILNGEYEYLNENTTITYMSTIMSDETGSFNSDIVLTRTYTNKYSSPGLTIYFDLYRNNYPKNVNIKWYNDEILISEKDYVVDNSKYLFQNNVNSYNKIVITFINMNNPYTYLKLESIEEGIIKDFYKDELISLSIIEETSSTSETLPINTFDFVVYNKSDIDIMFIRTRPLYLYKDNVLVGTFFIDTSKKDDLYNISSIDYKGMLDYSTYLGGMYVDIPASTVIADILGDMPYELEEGLGNKLINGYLPIQSKRLSLQQVLFNIGAIIDTSRTNKIVIKSKPAEVVSTIGNDRIISKTDVTNAITTRIQVTEHKYTLQEQTTELFAGKITGISTILFTAPATNLTVTNGTLITSGSNYAIVEGTGTYTTRIKGYTYQDSTRTVGKDNINTVITDLSNIKTYDSTLTTENNSSELLDNLNFTQKYSTIKYRVGTEKVGDIVTIDNENMRITKIDYDIDGNEIYGTANLEVL